MTAPLLPELGAQDDDAAARKAYVPDPAPTSSARQDLFQCFFAANEMRLHFAAHSHHPWPDTSFEAHIQYWEDSARWADLKWEKKIFPIVVPDVQRMIADILNLSKPRNIAFAPNTHEFVLRLLSCLPRPDQTGRPARILTTDSEFYSFDRQTRRMEEDGLITVTRIATEPFDTYEERMAQAAASGDYDLVFFSHVFFNSGYVTQDIDAIVRAVRNDDALVVIDGYHGFMAIPTDLSAVEDRVFYLSGGYKYAMSGEGACFMHVPDGYAMRPINTGWFADIGSLGNEKSGEVPFAQDGFRFWGATFDPSGLYRMRAVLDLMETQGITVEAIHNHVQAMQNYFIKRLPALKGTAIQAENLVITDPSLRGHFLTFRTDQAGDIQGLLAHDNVITDHRADRLRFGFGLYHDDGMIDCLIQAMEQIVPKAS